MSLDPAESRFPECPTCGHGVWDYGPHTAEMVDGVLYHPPCAPSEIAPVVDEQIKPPCDCGAPVGFEGFHAVSCASRCHAEPAFIGASHLVWFEGDICMWGDLMVHDKKAYLSAGYPF